MPDAGPWAFEAHIYRQGILRCVDVPSAVSTELDDWQYPPVVATVGGEQRATTLMRRRDGGFRLFLHDELRKAASVDTGDRVSVVLTFDEAPADVVSGDIIEAAERIDGGIEAIELLPPGLRREMLRFVGDAKSDAVRSKRVARVVELIGERAAKLRQRDGGGR